MPRSGTSWLSQIFDSHAKVRFRLAPLFSYAFKDYVNEQSSQSEWLEFFKKVNKHEGDEFMEQLYRKRAGEYPVFNTKADQPSFLVIKETRYHNLTTRILELLPEVKFVFLIRNPCAAIYSWLSTPREFPQKDDPMEYWRNGMNRKTGPEEFWGFDDWVKLTEMYTELMEKYPERVFIQRYEDLVREPLGATRNMFQFTGLGEVPKQSIEFLVQSHSTNKAGAYAVFKRQEEVLEKWKTGLPHEIRSEIKRELEGTKFEKYLMD